jgi:manganese-dependent inorganic pyrophosphatase
VLDKFELAYPPSIPDATAYSEIILLDASDLNGLEGKVPPEKVVEIIDHRRVHETHKFPNAKAQIELVGAAATLVAEKFMAANAPITFRSAVLLQAAIISNTLNFKGAVCTPRDVAAANWLQQFSQLPEGFWREMFMAKSDVSGTKLAERVDGDFAHFRFGPTTLGIAQIEMLGGMDLLQSRKDELTKLLEAKSLAFSLDHIFLNLIDLEGPDNLFFAPNLETQKILERALGVVFSGDIAVRHQALMRKQIVPRLKDILESA